MPARPKPRVAHVRTGCVTCKRRKVKCSEERPHCSRCIRAGFVCAGYAVPQMWLFKSRAETCKHVDKPSSEWLEVESANMQVKTQSSHQSASQDLRTSPLSPMKQGNSDPFNAYAIRLGPHETFLLRIVHSATVSKHVPSPRVWRRWKQITASDVFRYHALCLENESTAYGLLARLAAESLYRLKHHGAVLSTSVLCYMTRAQASVRKSLNVIGSSSMPPTNILRSTIWAGCFLADAEISLASQNADLHIRAVTSLVRRYLLVQMSLSDLFIRNFMHLMYLDIATSIIAFKSCHLDTTTWLPRLSEEVWSTVRCSLQIREYFKYGCVLHQTVTDMVLRNVMISQKCRYEVYDKLQAILEPTEIDSLCDADVFEELVHFGQTLTVAVDAKEILDSPGLTTAQIQHQNARIYLSIAVQLWMRLTSPTPIATNTFLDTAPHLLLYLKSAIRNSEWAIRFYGSTKEPYAAAKLWALYIGVITESQRRDPLAGGTPICGTWYHEQFREQVIRMQIRSWQQAVTIFEGFLGCEYVQPHISEWWPLLFLE